jgi:protein-arginine deiminase
MLMSQRRTMLLLAAGLWSGSLACDGTKPGGAGADTGTPSGTETRTGGDTGPGTPDGGDLNPNGPEATQPEGPVFQPPTIDLLADHNRNGQIDFDLASEDAGEDTWTAQGGAVFLANLDDDEEVCPNSDKVSDADLAACHDAADDKVNGQDDLLDMAPLAVRAWPEAPEGATGTLSVSAPGKPYVRFFKGSGSSFELLAYGTTALTTEELRAGLELRMEGLDIVRDTAVWDGYVDLTLSVADQNGELGSDTVRMRVAPVITYHHLMDPETVLFTYFTSNDSKAFRTDIVDAIAAGESAAIHQGLLVGDQWTQDFLEPGYMSMPKAGGGQHVMRANYRSANLYNPQDTLHPLREAGKVVYTVLGGKDSAGLTQYDAKSLGDEDSLNSFGNLEVIPPYTMGAESFPLGRIFQGSTPTVYPDPSFVTMIQSQAVQPPLYVDTSWLLVGHVDETVSFIKVPSPRGWALVMNDAVLAKTMLEEQVAKGNGDVPMFVGKKWSEGDGAEVSISKVLADSAVMGESLASAVEVDAQVAAIKEATGITDDEIIRVPYLHWKVYGYSVAYQPGTVNGLVLDNGNFLAPDPYGPVIDGEDIMKRQMEDAFAKAGWAVHWVEDWDLYHALLGEVHCGTNAIREIPEAKWWESGR